MAGAGVLCRWFHDDSRGATGQLFLDQRNVRRARNDYRRRKKGGIRQTRKGFLKQGLFIQKGQERFRPFRTG